MPAINGGRNVNRFQEKEKRLSHFYWADAY
jgi:hypothetical protein